MDTKSKNIKYRLTTKIIAAIVMWVSLVGILASSFFLLRNTDIIGTNSYEETYDYRMLMGRLAHNTVEFGTRFDHGSNKEEEEANQERYAAIRQNLSQALNFNYYIKDLETGKVSYKITGGYQPEMIKEQPNVIYIDKSTAYYNMFEYFDISEMLKNSPQEVYISLNNPLVSGDSFYDIFTEYTMVKQIIPYATIALIASLLLLLISFGYLLIVSGRKEKGGEVFLADIDIIYNDVQSFFVLVAVSIPIGIMSNISFRRISTESIVIMIILAIYAIIGMTYFFSMLRQLKKGVLLKNTLVWKVLSGSLGFIRGCFNQKIFKVWLLGIMLLYAFINGQLFSFTLNYRRNNFIFGSILIIIFNVIALYFAQKALKSLTVIMTGAKEISNGNLDYEMDQSNISTVFSSFAGDIQSIQGGLKNAVNEAIKGERMKTDLITNVSHDLKTPLTSIINYIDLLKQENMENETAVGYLNILDEKSARLKQLVEDLIEASKASSGNIVITTEQVDLNELVTQACGEYEEKIEQAQLDIRISTAEEKTWIEADGKYMWRIVENIMSNALKYSMPHTRVYIDIEKNKEYGVLIMKNISAHPLDIDPGQLTERFIRVDESRTTEGSGLGLSIAQSLATIQGGKFNIEIDGDLFKVRIEIPLWVENL